MIINTQGAYFNNPSIKAKYVDRYKRHMAADAVIQRIGYAGGKGCFIGCTLENYSHAQFEKELNLPLWSSYLADVYFEHAPSNVAAQFGLDVLEAIQCGQNIKPVRWKLAVWRHTKQLATLADNNEPYAAQCKSALQQVIEYCQSQIAGSPNQLAARSAARSAKSAAWSAEWSAVSSAARSAESAARSAKSAARSAAWSAAWSAESAVRSAESAAKSAAWSAESAARSAIWQEERDMFLRLIREGTK